MYKNHLNIYTKKLTKNTFWLPRILFYKNYYNVLRQFIFIFPDSAPGFVCWFSIISNGRSLIKYDKNNKFNIFNGFKVVIMLSVLYGHKYLVYATHPMLYVDHMEQVILIFLNYLMVFIIPYSCTNIYTYIYIHIIQNQIYPVVISN